MCNDLHDRINTGIPEHGCVCQKWLQDCQCNVNTAFGTDTTPVCKHLPFAAYQPSGFSPQLHSAALAALHSPVRHNIACMTLLFSVLQVGSSHLQALTAYNVVEGLHGAWSCTSRQQTTTHCIAGRSWLMPRCSHSTLSACTGSLHDRLHPDPISSTQSFTMLSVAPPHLQNRQVCQSLLQLRLDAA